MIEHSLDLKVEVSNDNVGNYSLLKFECKNKAGILTKVTQAFRDFNLDVLEAKMQTVDDRIFCDLKFTLENSQLPEEELSQLKQILSIIISSKRAISETRPKFLFKKDQVENKQHEFVEKFMDTYMPTDVLSIQKSIINHIEYTMARSRYRFDDVDCYQATAFSLRQRLLENWNDTNTYFREQDPKRVYYLSMEFLMGRSLSNNLFNLQLYNRYTEALRELGYKMEQVQEVERDAALGNGGLGRLAACLMDSLATMNYPAWGYGIRYQYGMFRQSIVDGFQRESPDFWLTFGNPWEIERSNIVYPVKFYGHVSKVERQDKTAYQWNAQETISAVAYDNPISGFETKNTINLRLWAAKPWCEFNLEAFNTGDYVSAVLDKSKAESISSVLYPDDRRTEGKELRLKQQYFLASASLQDVVRRYCRYHTSFDEFPEKVQFQLNDTHPSIAIPELMRILLDEKGLDWDYAWGITQKVFSFTNHTVMPQALERWPVHLLERVLPRHIQIIYQINWDYVSILRKDLGDDWDTISKLAILEETPEGEKLVRMANIAVITAHSVNGVAKIHTEILKTLTFKEFYDRNPEKFHSITNGVTQRRWLAYCNPPLRQVITNKLNTSQWIVDLEQIRGLEKFADDPTTQQEWTHCKQLAKQKCVIKLEQLTGIKVNVHAMFDIQVKRIHEYKRQLLNILGIIHRYSRIIKMSEEEKQKVQPKLFIIGGKAPPGYENAKMIIKLICAVSEKVNHDPKVGDLLKVVFLPDYNVSNAEAVIPAADLSQHISTAGTEASGTGNMKFTMNGGIIQGTMDGANFEIYEQVGKDNIFIFGARTSEVEELRKNRASFQTSERFNNSIKMITDNTFGWANYFQKLLDSIITTDYYLVANDFDSYVDLQEHIDEVYQDKKRWTRMSILNTARTGMFSSDRVVNQYAEQIWKVQPCPVPKE